MKPIPKKLINNELVFDRIASAVNKLEGNCRAQVSFAREVGPFSQF